MLIAAFLFEILLQDQFKFKHIKNKAITVFFYYFMVYLL